MDWIYLNFNIFQSGCKFLQTMAKYTKSYKLDGMRIISELTKQVNMFLEGMISPPTEPDIVEIEPDLNIVKNKPFDLVKITSSVNRLLKKDPKPQTDLENKYRRLEIVNYTNNSIEGIVHQNKFLKIVTKSKFNQLTLEI